MDRHLAPKYGMRFYDIFEGAVPSLLYHATLKTEIPSITELGLQPHEGKLWKGKPLVFAADDQHRRKLAEMMLQHISKVRNVNMNKVSTADVIEQGAVAVISQTGLSTRALGKGKPIPFLELGDYFTDQTVPVAKLMTDDEMLRFLGPQLRVWTKMVASGQA